MIQYAREQGVKEIWAGNYGAPVPAIENAVDRVITGSAFNEVAEIFGYTILPDRIEHPGL